MKNLFLLVSASVLFAFGASLGMVFGINPLAIGSTAVVGGMFAMKDAKGVFSANGIDISDLSALLSQFVKVPQNAAAIWYRVIGELELYKFTRKISGQTGKYAPLSSSNTELIQAFQKAFTPKGQVALTPYANDVFRLKVDYLLDNIDEIVDGYAQFLYDEKKERKDWPIVKYIVDNHLIPGIVKDLNTAMCTSVFVAPTPGMPGTTAGSMNGALTIIDTEITTTNITPIVTGATTSSNAIDTFNAFATGIAQEDLSKGMTLFVSKVVERHLATDRLNTYGLTSNLESANLNKLDLFPTLQVVGLEGMGSSQRMWATPTGPMGNLLHIYNAIFTPKSFDVQVVDRSIKMLTDFHAGIGFNTLDLVYANDQA